MPAWLSLTSLGCPAQELAMLRLLSKHLTPTAPAASAMSAPRPQQQFQPLNGSHKIIYLGELSLLQGYRFVPWCAGLHL
jgi:hypothetical protein